MCFGRRLNIGRRKHRFSCTSSEENAKVEPSPKSWPILLALVKNDGTLQEFLGIPHTGDGAMDWQKCGFLHNNQSFANLVPQVPSSNKRVTKHMKSYFGAKN